jgi:hypothetical protein
MGKGLMIVTAEWWRHEGLLHCHPVFASQFPFFFFNLQCWDQTQGPVHSKH